MKNTSKSKAEVSKDWEDLRKALKECRKIQISETLHIIDAKLADKLIQTALNAGKMVSENGFSFWLDENPVYDATQSGSSAYTWKGDKVYTRIDHVTKFPDGTISKRLKRMTWKKLES